MSCISSMLLETWNSWGTSFLAMHTVVLYFSRDAKYALILFTILFFLHKLANGFLKFRLQGWLNLFSLVWRGNTYYLFIFTETCLPVLKLFVSGLLAGQCASTPHGYAIHSYTIYSFTQVKNFCGWFLQHRYSYGVLFKY